MPLIVSFHVGNMHMQNNALVELLYIRCIYLINRTFVLAAIGRLITMFWSPLVRIDASIRLNESCIANYSTHGWVSMQHVIVPRHIT